MACYAHIEDSKIGAHVPGGKVKVENYHNRIDQLADAIEKDVITWRHDIHQNPELSNREFRTAKKVADHLTSLGFDEVRTGIAPTGVVGILKGTQPGSKVIALRADMDALPVKETVDVPFRSTQVDNEYPGGPFPVAHACGHDTHVAMLMGAASVLAQMRDEIPGTIMFVFQPAEEGPPIGEPFGAKAMIDAGVFNDPKPDVCFGMHISPFPAGHVAYAVGPQLGASEIFKIEIHGKQTHGSSPFTGLDPMPVLAAIDNGFSHIYRQIDPNEAFTISIGEIDTVGRTNIIGGTITAYGTARAIHDHILDDMNDRMQRVVEHAAQMHGLTATFEHHEYVPSVVNQQPWLDQLMPSIERIVGADRINQIRPNMGYDDVSQFINAVGGIYVVLGGQNTKFEDGRLVGIDPSSPTGGMVPNHNPGFYALDEAMKTGVQMHAHVALDFLSAS